MNVQQLREHFSTEFGLKKWPGYYFVDAETYAEVVQTLLELKAKPIPMTTMSYAEITLGIHSGPLFKGVELLLRK